jgi:hypothetical protein
MRKRLRLGPRTGRRLVATGIVAPLIGVALSLGGASTAQAACPTAGTEITSYTAPNGNLVVATTSFVNCDYYKRLQSVRFTGGSGTRGTYENPTYGLTSVYYRSNGTTGPIVGRVEQHYIANGTTFALGNGVCINPCHESYDGKIDSTGTDYTFITYDWVD